ncbi:hypothetical protein TPHA_0E00990 [Tetrapisispora phaffii CBS 4417]|uniref:UBX domain-containing protein n=1 Tax=Tetrapisispora phaffii (strain ATCC 24235 / CBS 4417 / NBRC 1672 / NRRL Y-8282 / UCD 70-5) TaxID=1071381 RepID=G8BTG5_TETPH|nr:hypothetical protein TPHA_0E00990 [Tetrapisispora phaffii CBS 4417]CCE63193.1 hypothetical protein TPHA_0E00990 [Tetrapisispora phaffii CBS 4417]
MSSENVNQFIALTSASQPVAEQYLELYSDDIGDALNAYYADQAERKSSSSQPSSQNSQQKSSKKAASSGNNKFMSFSQMMKDSDQDDSDENRHTFAGGEKSGLEVTDPNDSNSLIKDLLEKAKRGGQELPEGANNDESEKKNKFTGRGYRLGATVGSASEVYEDNSPAGKAPTRVTRDITFWKEGFQVGDGELFRYDDPANSFYLNELNQGRAPLKLLNVEFGQEVDVNVYKKLDESYKAPKRKLGGFGGKGQRLGSPIPGDAQEASEPTTSHIEESNKATEEAEKKDSNKTQGDSLVQIRYATGKREIYHCNATDTVQSIYDHVKSNTNDTRPFALNTSFPVTPIENFEATLKDADLINSVVVQRWI